MATSKQINNIIRSVKLRVARLTRELKEANAKVAMLTAECKKVVEAEKKANTKKTPTKKAPAKKAPAKKKTVRRK